jgi:hypothetical protein
MAKSKSCYSCHSSALKIKVDERIWLKDLTDNKQLTGLCSRQNIFWGNYMIYCLYDMLTFRVKSIAIYCNKTYNYYIFFKNYCLFFRWRKEKSWLIKYKKGMEVKKINDEL